MTWTALNERGAKLGPAVRTETVGVPIGAAPIIRSRVPDQAGNYEINLNLGGANASARVDIRPTSDGPPDSAPVPK